VYIFFVLSKLDSTQNLIMGGVRTTLCVGGANIISRLRNEKSIEPVYLASKTLSSGSNSSLPGDRPTTHFSVTLHALNMPVIITRRCYQWEDETLRKMTGHLPSCGGAWGARCSGK